MADFDVIIVGAGLSGIGAAYHLSTRCPTKSYAILEARDAIGGTWDLFRYPGIRSDSDMFTLGYSFRPWKEQKAIADGPSILKYVRDTAVENGIDRKIRFGHKVVAASWSSDAARWTLEVERTADGQRSKLTANFLYSCSGYYDYDAGYTPELAGVERFRGRIVHPQKWTDDISYEGKRVVVIGSGATAVTLVPELAKKAAHVVMLQRSPTYVVSLPAEDKVALALRKLLPTELAYAVTRWKNVSLTTLFYQLARRQPAWVRKRLLALVEEKLGPDHDIAKDWSPRYAPWDQRLCLVPDDDLFIAMRERRAEVVTDTIDTFTERGLRLSSGRELEADLVVTATGLALKFFGGVELSVDGRRVDPGDLYNYKGMMFSDVPNLVVTFGYTNASWTLKADLIAEYTCRLLNHMDAIGARQATPRQRDPNLKAVPFADLTSGYIRRALDKLPKQGDRLPWRLHQNYFRDILLIRRGVIEDGVIEFANTSGAATERATEAAARA